MPKVEFPLETDNKNLIGTFRESPHYGGKLPEKEPTRNVIYGTGCASRGIPTFRPLKPEDLPPLPE